MLKRLWHLLFDDRYVAIRRFRSFHLWFAWTPYIGGCVDFNIQFIPAHTAHISDEDDDLSWGPEFKLGADLIWVSFGLSIPNDDHPDNEIKMPPRHCKKCGVESEPYIFQRCPPCGKPVAACACFIGCVACEGCAACNKDCCSDCVNEIGEAGDLLYCECEDHTCMKQEIVGGTAVGFDGCPACTFGEGRSCQVCDYDCCSDCTYDQKVEVSRCPTCGQMTREGTISVQYQNEVCHCEGHVCGVSPVDTAAVPPVPANFVIPDQTTAVDPSSVPLKPPPDAGGSNANV